MSNTSKKKVQFHRLEVEIPTFLCAELREEGEKAGLLSDEEIWGMLTSSSGKMAEFQKLGYVILSFDPISEATQVRPTVKELYETYKKRRLGNCEGMSKFPIKLSPIQYSQIENSPEFKQKFFEVLLYSIIHFVWFLIEYNKGKAVGGFDKATRTHHSIDADELRISKSKIH